MNRLNSILRFVNHYKYLIVFVGGTLVVGFLDENSFIQRIKLEWQINDLEKEISKYNAMNDACAEELRNLKRDPNAIKRIAREKYFMKADNEDIFVLSDDPQPENNQSTDEKTK